MGLISLVRNVTFEPSLVKSNDTVEEVLRDIAIAFRMKKPAIISSHRINYVGYLDFKNRDINLKMLKGILKQAMIRWPDIEFMNSVDLGNLILKEKLNETCNTQ